MTEPIGPWRINGLDLGDQTTFIVRPGMKTQSKVRGRSDRLVAGTERYHRTGLDLAVLSLVARFHGSRPRIYQEAEDYLALLEGEDVVTIEAPEPLALWRSENRVAVTCLATNQKFHEALSFVEVEASLKVQGVWTADGGTFCEVVSGWFEKTAGGWLDQDGNTYTDAEAPLITLPEQASGYPTARANTDLEEDTLTAASSQQEEDDEGDIRISETFDLTSYLHPSTPAATGDVANFAVCSSPTARYLSGTDTLLGIGSYAIGTLPVGTT